VEQTKTAGADAPLEVDAPTVLPEDPAALDAPATADALPAADRPLSESVETVAGDDMGLSGPGQVDHGEIADVGGDPATVDGLAGELDGLLDAPDSSSGLDGRNPAADGGHATEPQPGAFHPDGSGDPDLTIDTTMGGNPASDAGLGDGSAAGKLTERQQAVVDAYKAEANAAAADGDFDKADRAAQAVQDFLVEEGVREAPAAPTTAEGTEMITSYGSIGGGSKPVWNPKTGEVEQADSLEGVEHSRFVTESVQMEQTGTDADGDGGDGTGEPPSTGGGVEDRAPGGDAPDRHRDFTDAFLESKLEAEGHGDIDPHPDDVGGVAIGAPPTDVTSPVEQYEEGYAPAPEYDVHDVDELHHDLTPEEEFLEH
jgi:hypothetical protein